MSRPRQLLVEAEGVSKSVLIDDLLGALAACQDLMYGIAGKTLDLDHLALDTADPLVMEVEAFVKAYHSRYGSPVR